MSSDDLDDAIDEAVRGLMSGEPAPGLRARVMRGIETPAPRRLFTWPRFSLAAGTVAVAALVMLQVSRGPEVPGLVRPPAPPPAVAVAPAPRVAPPPRTAGAAPPGNNLPSSPSLPVLEVPRPLASDSRIVSAASLIDVYMEVGGLSPLDAVEPIAIAPLRGDPLQLSEIAIAPLQFEALRVEPLSSPPR